MVFYKLVQPFTVLNIILVVIIIIIINAIINIIIIIIFTNMFLKLVRHFTGLQSLLSTLQQAYQVKKIVNTNTKLEFDFKIFGHLETTERILFCWKYLVYIHEACHVWNKKKKNNLLLRIFLFKIDNIWTIQKSCKILLGQKRRNTFRGEKQDLFEQNVKRFCRQELGLLMVLVWVIVINILLQLSQIWGLSQLS